MCVCVCVCHNSTIARYTLQVAANLPAVVRRAGRTVSTHRQTELMIRSSVSCAYIILSPHCTLDYTLHSWLSDNQSVPKTCLSLCFFATDKEHTLWYTGCACRHSGHTHIIIYNSHKQHTDIHYLFTVFWH